MRGTGNESSGAGSKACWSGSKVKETFQEAFPTPPLSSLPGFHGFLFFFFFLSSARKQPQESGRVKLGSLGVLASGIW